VIITHKEVLTFVVVSHHSESTYEVDLAANRPHGRCSCQDYEFRQRPNQKNKPSGDQIIPQRCKHIQAVRDHITEKIISKVINDRQKSVTSNLQQAKANQVEVRGPIAPSSHRVPTMSEMSTQPVARRPSPDTKISSPKTGVGVGKLNSPVPPMPRLD